MSTIGPATQQFVELLEEKLDLTPKVPIVGSSEAPRIQAEIEVKLLGKDPADVRQRLVELGAELIYPEFLMKRYVYEVPEAVRAEVAPGRIWLRLRREHGADTLTLKIWQANKVDGVSELEYFAGNYRAAERTIPKLGCVTKAYQETKREAWMLAGVEIVLDTWPYLEPFVEMEGSSEKQLKDIATKLGYNYKRDSRFGAIDTLYIEKYKITAERINDQTPLIKFGMASNPFLG